MNKDEHIAYWLESADYDITTAMIMLENKRLLYVGFLCHQSAEKILKAYWCKTKDLTPLKIHTLRRLAELTGLTPDLHYDFKILLAKLEPLNIVCRYPDYKFAINKSLTPEYCTELINETKNFRKWIEEKL